MEAAAVPAVAVPPDNADAIVPAEEPESSSRLPVPRVTFTVRPQQMPAIFQDKPIGLNELHKASLRGDYVHAESLVHVPMPVYDINERVPSDSPTLGGFTPLLLAAAIDRDHVVRLLLTHGADAQARTLEGISALHLAVESRHSQQADYDRDSMLEFKDWMAGWLEPRMGINSPLLHRTVHNEQYHVTVRLLLAEGIDINVRDEWGFTPLHRASNVHSTQSLVRLLIHTGANVNARSRTGATPLHVAAESDHRQTAKLLIRYGSQVNAVTNEYKLTPLHLAVVHHHRRMIKLLLKRGADIEARTSHGYMPIHLAALSDNTDPMTLLLCRGAPVDVPAGEDNQTPLHMTCLRANDTAMKYLLRAGANVHSRCKKGMTPLHTLIITNHEHWEPPQYTSNMIDYLMRSGGDINIRDAEGRTALHLACKVDSKKLTHYLLDWNADMFAKDRYNRIPLDYCNSESLVEFRTIFWPYVDRLRCLFERPIGGDTWPQIKARYFIETVNHDLHAMSCYKLGENGPTLMDLVLKSPREISCRVTVKQLHMLERLIFVEGKQNFPIYYVRIGQKIQAINDELKKKDLFRPAAKALNKVLGWRIPEDCAAKLFEYVHSSDMNNLIRAGEHRFIAFAKNLVRKGTPDSSRSRGTKKSDAPKVRFSWSNIENDFESIYSPHPSCWL